MIEHLERKPVWKPVWIMPPIRDNWMTRRLGLFKDRKCHQIFPVKAGMDASKRKGVDD